MPQDSDPLHEPVAPKDVILAAVFIVMFLGLVASAALLPPGLRKSDYREGSKRHYWSSPGRCPKSFPYETAP